MSDKNICSAEGSIPEKQNLCSDQENPAAEDQPAGKGETDPQTDKEQDDNNKRHSDKEGETSVNPNKTRATSSTCKPKKTESLRVTISDPDIQNYREHMAEQAIICRFMGIWPTERALCQWIRQVWKPKGDVQLHLGARGFFTVVFTSIEDKDRVFEGGPYFLASAGLYMRPWLPNFVPEKESFTCVPVWIKLFSLPIDYWGMNALRQIGNKLGRFIKASEATLQKRYTSCARICVEMDVSGALHEGVWLDYRDEEYFQALDYEHIPFRCRKCHEHGHLIRDCPLNQKEAEEGKLQNNKAKNDFIKPKQRQRANRRRNIKGDARKNLFNNPFEFLDQDTDSDGKKDTSDKETEQAEQPQHQEKGKNTEIPSTEVQMQDRTEESDYETEMDTSEIGSEDQELNETLVMEGLDLSALVDKWRKEGIENAPEEEISKVKDLFIARQKALMDKQTHRLGVCKEGKNQQKTTLGKIAGSVNKRRRGRKSNGELLQDMGEILLNAGQIKQLIEYPSFFKPVKP